MRELYITPQFRKDLKKIPSFMTLQADETIKRLRINPIDGTLNIQKLKQLKGLWRVRISSYRLIYSFDELKLILHRIRHRKDIYKNL